MEIGQVAVVEAHLLLVGMVLGLHLVVRVEMELHLPYLVHLLLTPVVAAVGQEILVAVLVAQAVVVLAVILGLLREQMEPPIQAVEQAEAVQQSPLYQEAQAAPAVQAS
jgi:hypothetical protein